MSRFITLSKITAVDRYNDNEEGEGQTTRTAPTSVNVDAIRCFYPRKDNRVGTRLTFTDGGGFAVAESYEAVASMVSPN